MSMDPESEKKFLRRSETMDAVIASFQDEEADERTCLNCTHFRFDSGLTEEQIAEVDEDGYADWEHCNFLCGVCRRFPPTRLVAISVDDVDLDSDSINHWAFPAVAHCDSCGEFKRKAKS